MLTGILIWLAGAAPLVAVLVIAAWPDRGNLGGRDDRPKKGV